jgi:hypothetical protein
MKRLACALVIAGSTGALAGVEREAHAAQSRASSGLQLSIITPDPSSILDQFTLDVVCKGGVLDTVELYLDGALVSKRQLATMQTKNIISFKLDTLYLAAGDHDVVVKAYGSDGKPSSTNSRIRIPALDLNAPVRISYPQNGTQVAGVVPIKLSLDQDVMRLRPYVTFFVDKEFKVLRNTPPFEYQWDTTRASNGWHLIEAWSQTEDATAPTKARPVRVNVNNGGGETTLQKGVVDLRDASKPLTLTLHNAAKPEVKPGSRVDPGTAKQTQRTSEPGAVLGPTAVPQLNGSKPVAGGDSVRNSEPSALGYGASSLTATDPASIARLSAADAKLPRIAPKSSGGAAKQPENRMAVASLRPGQLSGLLTESLVIPVISKAPTVDEIGTVASKPGENAITLGQRTGVNPSEIARLNNVKPTSPLRGSIIVPRSGTFDVAFNGTQIAFDVQPRVESGVGLTPFRQIFEHAGGRLYWFGGASQTVKAINERREIQIKIGDPNAVVNNQKIKMEKNPFLDRGRTIVPLSFIRDSMDVKINFDEKTGRLLIESKK